MGHILGGSKYYDTGVRVKDYGLNKEKPLKQKVDGCLSEFSISYANKHGNHIFEFSRGATGLSAVSDCGIS